MLIFNEKNITTKQISFWCSVLIACAVTIVLLLAKVTFLFLLVTVLVLSAFIYFLINFVMENFFYNKIKLVYKFISQTKASVQEESLREIVMPHVTLNQVEEDVQHWAEERAKAIDVLEKNEVFRKEFLMNFAHEIKTPIFTVQGYLHTLQDGAINDEKVRDKFVSNAIKGIDRLGDLVMHIDQIAKLETGIIDVHLEKFVIQELIVDVMNEFDLQAQQLNLVMHIKPGCDGSLLVKADKRKIKQVLVNLINNAIKYAKQNGKIEAGIYVVDTDNVFIEITDEGIGIAEENVPRVFERFYRTDNGRSRNAGGSGLGLAIVKHIIEAHGHQVTCRSKINVGSSFGFGLSLA